MTSLLPSIPYPPPGEGVWGPVTSTLDWCEENYYATKYCAEIINSITNITFAYLGFKGVVNILKNGHDKVFLVGFTAYLIIGLGSFCFHSTLTHEMQLVDEISMIYTACVMVYATFSHGRTTIKKWAIGGSVTSLAIFITVYYFQHGDPVFHQVAFFLLTLLVVCRGIYIMEYTLRPERRNAHLAMEKKKINTTTNGVNGVNGVNHGATKSKEMSEQERQKLRDERDRKILGQMYTLLIWALFNAYGGFTIWNLDNKYCSTIRRWRHEMGMPWGFILEGHGWWHIMTGLAAYCNVNWNIWMRYCLRGQQDEVELVWPSLFFSVPSIVKKDSKAKTA